MIKTIIIAILFVGSVFAKNSTDDLSLIKAAKNAREKSYCPYSNYAVGAAIKTKDNKIYKGVNVENASYGLVICAERSAVFNAVTDGNKNIEEIAIVTKDGGAPCGGCRQVLNEFNPNMIVIISNEDGSKITKYRLKELLPDSFGPHNLKK